MDSRLTVLKLFVEELGERAAIGDFDSRKRLQKAVYLGQLAGVDLGYRYSWYLKGPYSTSLTRDYYALAEEDIAAEGDQEWSLAPAAKAKLDRIKGIFEVPADVPLDRGDWLELVASWHYLNHVSRLSNDQASETMRIQKPQLYPYLACAKAALQRYELWAK